MANLREQVRAASKAAVKTEDVEIDGLTFRVRGMMQGERLRVAAAEQKGGLEKSVPLLIALTVYDPDTDKPLWNGNVMGDREEIGQLPPDIADKLQEVAAKLSGLGDEGKSLQPEMTGSPMPSSGEESEDEPSTS